MNKTKIDWADYSINPVKGLCPMACPYCYARRMYKRFHWSEGITYNPSVFQSLPKFDHVRVFVGSTMELFGEWVKPEWMHDILDTISELDHTFIFLTKRPENLQHWKFPPNVWVGVSTTGFDARSSLEDVFQGIEATVKFVSIEPLLDYSPMDFRWVDWVIVGQQTPAREATMPKVEWIRDIVDTSDKAGCKVFLKDNLAPLFAANGCEKFTEYRDKLFRFIDYTEQGAERWHLRQEFPVVRQKAVVGSP